MEKFNDKKERNLNFLRFIGDYVSDERFERIQGCGSYLEFYSDETFEHQKLHKAYFCGHRFCPYCNWRKSRKQAVLISTLLKYLKSNGFEFLFLTLTAPNVSGDELKSEIERFSSSFTKMIKRKKFSQSIEGYVRNLEITYNKKTKTFHPHLHVILCVQKSYFTNPKKYISRAHYLKIWQECMKDDRITQVDVRKIDTDSFKAIAEVSKYTSKDSDYLISKEVFDIFFNSLKGKNGVSYGGKFKEAKKLYNSGQLEYLKEKDLVEYIYLITYVWGPKQYQIESLVELSEEEKKQINNKIDFIKEVEDDL